MDQKNQFNFNYNGEGNSPTQEQVVENNETIDAENLSQDELAKLNNVMHTNANPFKDINTNQNNNSSLEMSNDEIEKIAKIMAAVSKLNNDQYRKEDALKEIDRQRDHFNILNKGKAAANFIEECEKEMEDPNQVAYLTFYPSMAKKYGSVYSINISGYSIGFVKGLTTKFPKRFVNDVNLRFNGLMNAQLEAKMGGSSPAGNKNDDSFMSQEMYDRFKSRDIYER